MTDLIFEAICEVCGIDWRNGITKNERGRVNAARKELGDIHAEPATIHAHAAAYRRAYPTMPLTPQALTGNWTTVMAREKEASPGRTNTHARRGCKTCGDDHVISAGYDQNGYEQVTPCPDCQ